MRGRMVSPEMEVVMDGFVKKVGDLFLFLKLGEPIINTSGVLVLIALLLEVAAGVCWILGTSAKVPEVLMDGAMIFGGLTLVVFGLLVVLEFAVFIVITVALCYDITSWIRKKCFG